ncbi:MAG: T9SS type A sorting domain-containing protein [Bacteroidota bacterium]
MKKAVVFILLILFYANLNAQNNGIPDKGTYKVCDTFFISKPLKELAEQHPAKSISDDERRNEAADKDRHNRIRPFVPKSGALPANGIDPIRQLTKGIDSLTPPLSNFDGQPGDAYPADPSGAANSVYYVQAVNDQYRAYYKNGNPAMSSLDLSTLWSGSVNDGDPIVMYDRFADRWFIQQFQVSNSPYKILIAISTTNDPTGAYYVYTFSFGNNYPDYPKFSIWHDGYYMVANFDTQKAVVYERAKMLVGDNTAAMITTSYPSGLTLPGASGFWVSTTLDADGQLPPSGTPENIVYFNDDNQGAASDQIVICNITTNWINHTAVVTLDTTLATQPFNSYFTGGTLKDIVQPSGGEKLDALDGIFSYRAPYMRFTNHNSVVLCNTVNLGSKIAGIRWYELRQNLTNNAWSIYQQGTYGPADATSRWTGSIAMNNDGSIGLAYSVTNASSLYPGIRYTGRLATDPLGQMTFTEQTAKAGTSVLSGVYNRWGDYSQTSLDPDGITFWHTNEYSSGGQKTRIFAFQIINPLTGIEKSRQQPELTCFQSDNILVVKAGRLPASGDMIVELFDIDGKNLARKTLVPVSGSIETNFDTSKLAKGIYLVRVGNNDFQRVVKVLVK